MSVMEKNSYIQDISIDGTLLLYYHLVYDFALNALFLLSTILYHKKVWYYINIYDIMRSRKKQIISGETFLLCCHCVIILKENVSIKMQELVI